MAKKALGKELGVETWNCGRNGASIDRIVRMHNKFSRVFRITW